MGGFPPILLGIKEGKRKKNKSKRKKRKGLVSIPFSGHPLDTNIINLDKNFPFQCEIVYIFFARFARTISSDLSHDYDIFMPVLSKYYLNIYVSNSIFAVGS